MTQLATRIPWIYDVNDNSGSLWDTLRAGGVQWPGVWSCKLSKKRDLDIQKLRRFDGARILDNGYFGPALSCSGRFWTPEQWFTWQDILPTFDPQRPGGGRSPLDFYHPAAALFSVNTVYIAEISVGEPASGILPIGLEVVQWFPRPKPFVQGFAGTRRAGENLNPKDFEVPNPSSDTGSNLG